jgi:glycosyltransferase involved in cell wall biosynthesis
MTDTIILKENSTQFFESSCGANTGYIKNALFIIPDLQLNGAQTVLYNMISLFQELKYTITVISPDDGPYRRKYTDIGANVAIRPIVSCSEEFKDHMRKYDLVFLNSSSCLPYLYFFINTSTPVLFWLHETEQQLTNMAFSMPHPQLFSPNIHIAGVTRSVQRGIKKLYNYDISLLPMPVPYVANNNSYYAPASEDKVEFFIPAAYTYIKGQDILLAVISRLPKPLSEKSHFTFCGYKLSGQEEYYQSIKSISDKLENVTFMDQLDQKEVYNLYRKSTCVIAPSRIDATPTTIVEALMFNKLVLVSSNAGISEYITDCVNGFVFTTTDELYKRLLLIISDSNHMDKIKDDGHLIYKENFSKESVMKKLLELI